MIKRFKKELEDDNECEYKLLKIENMFNILLNKINILENKNNLLIKKIENEFKFINLKIENLENNLKENQLENEKNMLEIETYIKNLFNDEILNKDFDYSYLN